MDITLQYTTIDGQQVIASCRSIVYLTDLARVQPGGMLPLRYDPANPQKIMIDKNADQAGMQAALDRQMVASGTTTQEMIDIANNGVITQGVILSAQPTGNIINGMGEMTLHIKVTRPANGGTFETTVNKAVPQASVAYVQPGSVIEVYYMPGNEQKIAMKLRLT